MNTTVTQAPDDERQAEAIAEISIEQKESQRITRSQPLARSAQPGLESRGPL